jgi:hypothetical protein
MVVGAAMALTSVLSLGFGRATAAVAPKVAPLPKKTTSTAVE